MNSNLPIGQTAETNDQIHNNGDGKGEQKSNHEFFRHFASATSAAVGSPVAFIIAAAVIVVWGITGPMYHYSDTWQLIINTGTTIVTFLMVFLIQSTQNRDARAIHLKLDELIRAKKSARNKLVDLENCSDEEIEQLEQEFSRFRAERAPQQREEHQTT